MSTHRLEARVSALERRQLNFEAYIEESSADMTANIKHLADDVKHLSDDMTASFKQLVEYEIHTERQIDARFEKIEGDISTLKGDVANIKVTMATKDDLTAMENRILDTFKRLLPIINPPQPPTE